MRDLVELVDRVKRASCNGNEARPVSSLKLTITSNKGVRHMLGRKRRDSTIFVIFRILSTPRKGSFQTVQYIEFSV
jgi:hypothetical protein